MMGMYCCCGWKLTGIDEKDYAGCKCNWEGWFLDHDWPKERPPSVEIRTPTKDGLYIVRKQSTGGDRYEDEEKYFVNPLRIDEGGYYETFKYPVHWEKECWDDDSVYAWKEL